MRLIYKTKLNFGDVGVYLPKSAEILDVGFQDSDIVMWYSFEETDVHDVLHKFRKVGTGFYVPESSPEKHYTYIKTLIEGPFVWHIFKK